MREVAGQQSAERGSEGTKQLPCNCSSGLSCSKGGLRYHWINDCPLDSVVCFVSTYPLDSDLSGG